MRLLIAAGGTGGHIFPGIALAEQAKKQFATSEILFAGRMEGMEGRIVPKSGFKLSHISVRGLRGKSVFSLLSGLFLLPFSLFQALILIKKFKPHAAISCGGYVAGPVLLAAWLLRVPCYV